MSVYTHEIKREENAKILLTIHVPKDIVMNMYQEHVQSIAKQAHIKGFRKGKAPINVLEQKFGESFRIEATDKIIREAIKAVIDDIDEKPLFYSFPQLEEDGNKEPDEFLIDPKKEYSFTVSYDTEPNITLADIRKLEITKFNVEISEQDVDQELKKIQAVNAIITDTDAAVEKGNIVMYNCVELDEDNNEIASSKKENISVTIEEDTDKPIGAQEDIFEFNDELIGMKRNETKIITKTYPKDYPHEPFAGKTMRFQVHVTKVRVKELPALDDELAQDVNEKYHTLEDLKTDIRKQMEVRAKDTIYSLYRNEMTDYLIAHSTYEIPQSAITFQLTDKWQQFITQYGGNEQFIVKSLAQSGSSKEQIMEQWKESATHDVIEQLLLDKFIESEKKEMTDAELENILKEEREDYKEIIQYYKEQNLLPNLKYNTQQKIALETQLKLTTIKEEKNMTFTELLAYSTSLEHTHNHEHGDHNHEHEEHNHV